MRIVRTLTIVKDSEGKVRIAQFGSNSDEEENSVSDQIDFFKKFVSNENLVQMLSKKILKVSFFSEPEFSDFCRGLYKGNKRETDYDNEFLDTSVGVYILQKFEKFNSGTRLLSFYKFLEDSMFASIKFLIDFQKKIATITDCSGYIFRYDIPDFGTIKNRKKEDTAKELVPTKLKKKSIKTKGTEDCASDKSKNSSIKVKRRASLW